MRDSHVEGVGEGLLVKDNDENMMQAITQTQIQNIAVTGVWVLLREKNIEAGKKKWKERESRMDFENEVRNLLGLRATEKVMGQDRTS